jgi:hypothetical protein
MGIGDDESTTAAVLCLLTSTDPHWITTGSREPQSHFYNFKLKTIHKKYTNSTQQTNTQITKYLIHKRKDTQKSGFNFYGKVSQRHF